MPNLLDDVFSWAAQQPATNITTVRLAIASNEITRNNLVSYAEGTLFYRPPHHVGIFWTSAQFASEANGITQYFSDRRFAPGGGGFATAPFDPNNTDPLDVTIVAPGFLSTQYSITVHSSKWNFQFTFDPSFDAATEVIYGAVGPTFFTLSLCERNSQPPPQ
jgi:hypothetical protein